MKTKIIYISGNEVFDMADIRAAFEEVRAALGLGTDTVMFGVPVDADDALNAAAPATITPATTQATTATEEEIVAVEQTETPEPITDTAVATTTDIDQAPAPKKAVRRGRPKKAEETVNTPTDDIVASVPESAEPTPAENEKVIPILSVLATKVTDDAPIVAESAVESDTSADAVIQDIDINAELTTQDAEQVDGDATHVTIGDMINDDVPAAPREKTLEELLESMTPLREDHADDIIKDDAPDSQAEIIEEDMPIIQPADDGDATLEQLAAEFAQTEDTLPAAPRVASHGKIGKLKNILPFKKAKREDSGLMGDLFGWAGIAANDEDFSIPGFFTPTAAKK